MDAAIAWLRQATLTPILHLSDIKLDSSSLLCYLIGYICSDLHRGTVADGRVLQTAPALASMRKLFKIASSF